MRSQSEQRFILCKHEVDLHLKCVAIEHNLVLFNRGTRAIDTLISHNDGALTKDVAGDRLWCQGTAAALGLSHQQIPGTIEIRECSSSLVHGNSE